MKRTAPILDLLIAISISAVWLAVAIATRPLIPIDETRYVAVAWEMHSQGDYLVPHLNGQIYAHKPPLFFWLINLAWGIFGVSEWAARAVGPVFSLGCVGLTYYLGRLAWPQHRQLAGSAVLLLVSGIVWSVFASLTMFDTGLCFFVILFAVGLIKLASGRWGLGTTLLALALAGGLLQKGPAVFLHTLPVALLAPYWVDRARFSSWTKWYAAVLVAVLLALSIVSAWAVPAMWSGGSEYAAAILWRQSAGRVVNSFAHQRPVWWYLPIVPALLFPWSLTWPAWRGLPSVWREPPVRLCLLWFVSSCLMFSMLSGKQIHYLLPVVPFAALLTSRLLATLGTRTVKILTRCLAALYVLLAACVSAVPLLADRILEVRPLVGMTAGWVALLLVAAIALAAAKVSDAAGMIRRAAVMAVLVWTIMNGTVLSCLREKIDLGPFARDVARYQRSHPDIAYVGKYHGQFQFLGRLERPIHELSSAEQLPSWIQKHPQGLVILSRKTKEQPGPGLLAFCGDTREVEVRRVELWEARSAPTHVLR